uniref:Apolipoprotein D n=1 Tax=Fundulus heteroclitus TaxID=8078 RepID=A0A146ZT58_FUNHE
MSPSYFIVLLLPLISAQTFHWGGCPDAEVQDDFQLEEYMGKWYEIEKLPAYFAEGKCIEADYLLKKDGTVQVVNSQVVDGERMAAEGIAKVMDEDEPAKLGVSFTSFTPYSPYWVLKTDYTNVTVVYSCTDVFNVFHLDYAWILSRSPSLPEETVQDAKDLLISEGIDVSAMEPTEQDCHEDEDNDSNEEEED